MERTTLNTHKQSVFIALFLLILSLTGLQAHEIITFTSYDGVDFKGRLHYPAEHYQQKLVIDVPGSGPHTYLNRRKIRRSIVFITMIILPDSSGWKVLPI